MKAGKAEVGVLGEECIVEPMVGGRVRAWGGGGGGGGGEEPKGEAIEPTEAEKSSRRHKKVDSVTRGPNHTLVGKGL